MGVERKCKDGWLGSLLRYAEENESPRPFWLWAGIFCIASALQRKVWIPYGTDPLYPNIYVMVVAPPGVCRKSAPLSFAKKILSELKLDIFADSPTRRALTMKLANLCANKSFMYAGRPHPHASLSVISKELSSFLAMDPKGMIEVLTDLFDSHDEWTHETAGKGQDLIRNICISCLFATTPSWIAANLPQEAIGGGFTSRFAILSGRQKYKLVSWPPEPPAELWNDLLVDLNTISQFKGPFELQPAAKALFDEWYSTIGSRIKETRDERLHGYMERMHIILLKVAMCIRVSYANSLTLTVPDIERASKLLDNVLTNTSDALGGHGKSRLAADLERVRQQLKVIHRATFTDILKLNYRNVNKPELQEILETLAAMDEIKLVYEGPRQVIQYNRRPSVECTLDISHDDTT